MVPSCRTPPGGSELGSAPSCSRVSIVLADRGVAQPETTLPASASTPRANATFLMRFLPATNDPPYIFLDVIAQTGQIMARRICTLGGSAAPPEHASIIRPRPP